MCYNTKMPTFYTSPKVYQKAKEALYKATHKKITRKGCKNVQLVWYESDGEWVVEKIHPLKPAVFITKKIEYMYHNGEIYSFQAKIHHSWQFPYREPFL